jgi:phage terminase small subunit
MTKPKTKAIKPPKHLKAPTRRWMQSILLEYDFDPADGSLAKLILAAEALDRSNEARDLVSKEGLTVADRFGQQKQHPAAAVQRDFSALHSRLMRELNLTEQPADNRPPRLKYGGR